MKLALVLLLAACSRPSPLDAPEPAPPSDDLPAQIDAIATTALADTRVPSAQIAVVRDGKILYEHAYGDARLDPDVPATTAMHYSIGSVSKQFTAAAVLLLAEDGKLSIDDPVGTYIPNLTDGDRVTIRQILSHTSGYRDYAPQDYIIPAWLVPTTGDAILDHFARVPLDFEPGTRWQYSNTNFVLAAEIVEKVSGERLFAFLKRRVFDKLGMTTVISSDAAHLPASDPEGYFRRANGPAHVSPHEAPGWYLGAAELAMTAHDLATWDISMIDRTVMTPASYLAMETEVLLANGAGTRYGLGVSVSQRGEHRYITHSGEVGGFIAENDVLPDDGIAVVALTNQDASSAAQQIASRVEQLLLANANPAADKRVRGLLDGLARGELDRTQLTANANAYFTDDAIREYRDALAAAGAITKLTQNSQSQRGGMTYRSYSIACATKSLSLSVFELPDGTIEQFLID
nr:serine hydrolase domain-containing protein [Kofleriaceae bacterium]